MSRPPPALDRNAARRYALKALTRREYGGRELAQKLERRGFPAAVAETVVSQLKIERMQSDDRFVEAFVHARRRRGYGPVRIRMELATRGIDEARIARALSLAPRRWREDLKRAWHKRFGAEPPRGYTERAKQARFLQQRGFSAEQIRAVLGGRVDEDEWVGDEEQ